MSWGNGSVAPRVITAFAAPVTVSTVTPLQALTDWGAAYADLAITLRNHDGTKQAALYIDTSESGVVVDSTPTQVIVPPLKEYRLIFRDIMSLYWAISASGDPDAGYAAVDISYEVIGLYRLRSSVVYPRTSQGVR